MTVYKLFNTYPGGYAFDKKCEKRLLNSPAINADVIIIDEISMVDRLLFQFVVRAVNWIQNQSSYREIQLIMVGDFFQLPPVRIDNQNSHNYAFDSPYWDQYMTKCVELDTPHRQEDMEFCERLLEIRRGVNRTYNVAWLKQHAHYLEEKVDAVYLAPRRETAEKINRRYIDALSGEERVYYAKYRYAYYKRWFTGYFELGLKVGTRVMAIANDPRGRFVNGSLGTVLKLLENSVEVLFDSTNCDEANVVEIERHDFKNDNEDREECVNQIPLIPAYALTIHRAQGCTLECANIDLSCFESGQFYVALSRVKRIENIYIISEFSEKHIKADARIVDFYKRYKRDPAA